VLRPHEHVISNPYVFQNLFPARGRKRSKNESTRPKLWLEVVFQNLFPARGRKPHQSTQSVDYLCRASFSEPIPRKGTETNQGATSKTIYQNPFFRTYSPQGDGNNVPVTRQEKRKTVFQNLFPARGRKPTSIWLGMSLLAAKFFRTYSPQGDGNVIISSHPLNFFY